VTPDFQERFQTLTTWLEEMKQGLEAMRQRNGEGGPQRKFQEFKLLSDAFLSASKGFLELAQVASRAAEDALREAQREQGLPPSEQ
jgi:hypothetical protein